MRRLEVSRRGSRAFWHAGAIAAALAFGGCTLPPSAHTATRDYDQRPDVPVDAPGRGLAADGDCAAGGQLYKQYCGSCHNARPLGERPFNNYEVVVAHMRDQAYLTGREYRQIIQFLRRWHDVGPPTPDVDPSPKRLVPPQPIAELRGGAAAEAPTTPPAPPTGASPFQVPEGEGAAGVAPAQPVAPAPIE